MAEIMSLHRPDQVVEDSAACSQNRPGEQDVHDQQYPLLFLCRHVEFHGEIDRLD